MTRIDTPASERAIHVYKNVAKLIKPEYSAFGNNLITFGANFSKSTRSFYINICRMDAYKPYVIRVSDHMNGFGSTPDTAVTFDDLTEDLIINAIEKATGYTFDQVIQAKQAN
jgi:hypothetical protein